MKTNFLKSSLVLALLAIMAVSCKKNEENTPAENANPKVENDTMAENFSCLILEPEGGKPITEANGPTNLKWANGSVVKVRFSGGSTSLRSKVTQYAKTWEQYANITLQFVADNAAADVKVSFTGAASSFIGTESKSHAPSMYLGALLRPSMSESSLRGTTIHEFGHALGMYHEQSHPDSNIPWNKQVVYNELAGAPNYWSRATVDRNVFAVNSRTGLSLNAYDVASVMHYSVPARWTTNNVAIAPNNTTISQGDILFIKTYYPGR